ncbi:MAG: hypothetical protein ACREMY_20185, partial [bacterium]
MSATHVSIIIPLIGPSAALPSTLETIESYLHTTGFAFDVRVLDRRDGADYGAMIRRGAAEAAGSVIIVVDHDLPYPLRVIGDAVALIESGAAEVVFARRNGRRDSVVLRSLLVPILPDPALHLKAFSAGAAQLLIAESKVQGGGFDLEMAYLANKYGFRIEILTVHSETRPAKVTFDFWRGLASAITIRMTDRRNGYRAPRRCPVCFSNEVWNYDQIPGNVVRACSRC